MFGVLEMACADLVNQLERGYDQLFRMEKRHYLTYAVLATESIIQKLARSTALYHNADHTILVTLVGLEILRGKHCLERNVSPEDWLHYLLALLCHDIGFIRGVCQGDDMGRNQYGTGVMGQTVELAKGATDASLAPYHVDRSQQFVKEFVQRRKTRWLGISGYSLSIDIARIQAYIERTRFPAPEGLTYQETHDYPGLTRAADLIGQLSDPLYLQKTTALFYEFEETGVNRTLGYRYPDDVWLNYPKFFRDVVYHHLGGGLRYLQVTRKGQCILEQLYRNVITAEKRRRQHGKPAVVRRDRLYDLNLNRAHSSILR